MTELADCLERCAAPWLGRGVLDRDLPLLEAELLSVARSYCRHHYGYILDGWSCSVFLLGVQEHIGQVALRKADAPQDFVVAPMLLVPGVATVAFFDPHGLACEPRTLEEMARQRWNWGLGWGGSAQTFKPESD